MRRSRPRLFSGIGLWGAVALFGFSHGMAQIPTPQAEMNTLIGRVFDFDQRTPLVNAVVMTYHFETGRIFSSEPTKDTGSFSLSGLPGGFYEIAIEAEDQLFVVGEVLEIQGGVRRPINLALGPGQNPVPEDSRITIHRLLGRPALLAMILPMEKVGEGKKGRGRAIGISAGTAGAFLLNGLLQGDEDTSPSKP